MEKDRLMANKLKKWCKYLNYIEFLPIPIIILAICLYMTGRVDGWVATLIILTQVKFKLHFTQG